MTHTLQSIDTPRHEPFTVKDGAKACFAALFYIFFISGCGGISDGLSEPSLSVRLKAGNRTLSNQRISIAISTPYSGAFTGEQVVNTDADGSATATFKMRWSSAFFIIPPIGNVPRRPKPPLYLVSWREHKTEVSKNSPGTIYRWKNGRWLSETTILFLPH